METTPKANWGLKQIGIYALALCLGLALAYVGFSVFSVKTVSVPAISSRVVSPQNVVPVPPPPPAAPAAVEKPVQEAVAPAFTLNGIFVSGPDSYVLINNEVLRVNDSLQGATVKNIQPDRVVLQFDGKDITLYVQ
jgi:type II secretory pathway component PulC